MRRPMRNGTSGHIRTRMRTVKAQVGLASTYHPDQGVCCTSIYRYPINLLTDNKCHDQAVKMDRMMYAFGFSIYISKVPFRMTWPTFFCLWPTRSGSVWHMPYLPKHSHRYTTRPRGYKFVFMLNSAEHEIFSANRYENANNSWHFHIY